MLHVAAKLTHRALGGVPGGRWFFGRVALIAQLTSGLAIAQLQQPNRTLDSVRAYEILQPDWALMQMPARNSARRGALQKGARVLPFSQVAAPGCKLPWWQVGPYAWMCPDPSMIEETAANENDFDAEAGGVLGHVIVGKNGTLGYKRREDVDVATPSAEMQRGFMLGFTQMAGSGDGAALLTTHGLWVPAHDVQLLKPSDFQGVAVQGELEIAWVFTKRAPVYSAPDVRRGVPRWLDRLTSVTVEGQQQRPSGLWVKFADGWLKATDLRIPEPHAPPNEVGPNERWLDVDTRSQTLVAYVGAQPVYATLVSTGKGKPGSEQATPLGVHRLWIKLLQSDMDNLESTDPQSVYAVEAVPHVMFFQNGYGIHGTYWHDEFGQPKSHGCVNVSLTDARWLFQFAGPHLPHGWSAVFPIALEPGTVVRVR